MDVRPPTPSSSSGYQIRRQIAGKLVLKKELFSMKRGWSVLTPNYRVLIFEICCLFTLQKYHYTCIDLAGRFSNYLH